MCKWHRITACLAGLIGLVVAGLAGSGGALAGARAPTVYDMYLGGFWLGALEVAAERDGADYRARARLGTGGWVRAFWGLELDASAEGQVGPRHWRPSRFTAETRTRRRARSLAMRFEDWRPVEVAVRPPFNPKPWQIDPQAQRGTSDPLSAFLTAAASPSGTEPCGHEADVYDGRRRHRITLGAATEEQGLRRCDALYARVGGFKPKMMKKPDFPFTVWFAPGEAGGWAFLRAMGETPFGVAVLRRRR
ncbi:MAG: DUF3108 domain-containing protein [Pseudomonadota bacterium]